MTAENILPFAQRTKPTPEVYTSDDLTVHKISPLDFLVILFGLQKKDKPERTETIISFGKDYRYLSRGKTGYFSIDGRVE